MAWMTACPAKINTFLSVGPPDARSYHPLRTIFQTISLADELVVQPASHDQLITANAELPEDNTITKTLRLVRELLPIPPLEMRLDKQIPSQAGLGGGSSNAAGLLRILMKMLPEHFEDRFAFEVAEAVGADVAFFLVGGRARGEGYGERLTPFPDPPYDQRMVVVMPEDRCSTEEAYQRLDSSPREWREFPPSENEFGYNDFERVAPCGCLELIELLEARGLRAMLTGSGSAVVGLCDDPGPVVAELRERGYWARAAQFLSRAEALTVEAISSTS